MLRAAIASVLAVMALFPTCAEAQWLNHPTPGIPRTADGKPDLSAPVPRTADGKPDLSGLWATPCQGCSADQRLFFDLAKGLQPSQVQMTPWAAAIQQQRQRRAHVDDPFGYCLPPGVPRIYFVIGFFRIISSPTITAFLHETAAGLMFRQVFTDGRPFPTVTEPTWLGYSVGHWDGDTFVIETTGFKDRGWLDTEVGRPHSDALRVTERLRRKDFGHVDLSITIDDAKAFLKPWTMTTTLTFQADTEILEAFCENHDKTMEHRRIDPAPPEPPSPPLPTARDKSSEARNVSRDRPLAQGVPHALFDVLPTRSTLLRPSHPKSQLAVVERPPKIRLIPVLNGAFNAPEFLEASHLR